MLRSGGRARTFRPNVVGLNSDCAVATLGPCALLLWHSRVVPQGVEWLKKALANVRTESPEKKIGFLTVTDASCDLTTPPLVRQGIAALLRDHEKQLAGAAIVFEGH